MSDEEQPESMTGVVGPFSDLSPRDAAVALGIMVPDDWTDERVQEAVEAFRQSAEAPPPPVTDKRWRGHSPRG